MKILIVSENHLSAYVGGNEVYADILAKGLAQKGHRINYLTAQGKTNFKDYPLHIVYGYSVGKFIMPKIKWFRKINQLKPDIVHASGSGIGITLLGFYCRFRKIKNVLTFQAPQTKSILGRIDEWIQLKSFGSFITTSPSNATYLKRRTKKNVDTVLLCTKPGFRVNKSWGKKRARQQLKLDNSKKYVLMVAKLDEHHYYKGLQIAIRAISKLPKAYDLLVIGDGPLKDKFMIMVQDLKIADRVKFLGFVPEELLPIYYLAVDVFILPSTSESEGFGQVLLEAMLCKTPTITTKCVGIATYLKRRGLSQVIAPRKVRELTLAIQQPLMYEDQIDKAFQFAVNRTSVTMVEEIERLYEKISVVSK